MATQDIIDYVMETPGNTNPTVLKNLIEDMGIYELKYTAPPNEININTNYDPPLLVGIRFPFSPEMFKRSGLYKITFDPAPPFLYQIYYKNTPKDGSPVDEDPYATSNLKRMGFIGGDASVDHWWMVVNVTEGAIGLGNNTVNHYKSWMVRWLNTGIQDLGYIVSTYTYETDTWSSNLFPALNFSALPEPNKLIIKIGDQTYTYDPTYTSSASKKDVVIEIPTQTSSTEETT